MPRSLYIRPLRVRELDSILPIEHASFGKDAYDRNLFAEYRHKCGDLFLVALRSQRICGYILTCIRAAGSTAELVSLAVAPAERQRGAASALLASTFRRLRRRKIGKLTLMVKVTNRHARRFYEKWGFTKVKQVRAYYEDGKDGIWMSKLL